MIDVYCVAHVSCSSNPVLTARVARFIRHVAYTMPLLVLLHSKSNLVEPKNCPTSTTDPKYRRRDRKSSDTWCLHD